ncbi:MAG: RNA-binding S4 domain-containing protein [Bacteroidia bacterium]|nr:RNA-binding S4 domain-containing protein [Bacteroidia bacterium]MCZ2249768.1 RNA-binding S4 domain-containing protein [Bacteroidia bacterium]
MNERIFTISSDYIELIKLLKVVGIAEHGAAAKQMVSDGMVMVNNQPESRFRAKIRKKDFVTVNHHKITIQ